MSRGSDTRVNGPEMTDAAERLPLRWLAAPAAAALLSAWSVAWLWRTPIDAEAIHGAAVLAALSVWSLAWAAALALIWAKGGQEGGESRITNRESLLLWSSALLLRVPLLFATPHFSDDIWRYLWEGKVLAAGLSPYAHAPAAFAGSPLASGDPFWPHINYPEISAIYPPLAELLFAGAAALWYSPLAVKAAMTVFDLGVLALLVSLLRRRGLTPLWALAWAWSPLAGFEVAGSGHLDVVAGFFALLWLHQLDRRREGAASLALGCAIAAKLVPALLIPVALRWHRVRWTVAWAALVPAALYLPFIDWQAVRHPAPGAPLLERAGLADVTRALREYGDRWRHNESLFLFAYEGVIGLARVVSPAGAMPAPASGPLARAAGHARAADRGEVGRRDNLPALRLAKAVCAAAYLVSLGAVLWRAQTASGAALGALGLWILLSPVVHPWYLLLVLPLAILERRPSWLALSALALLTYVNVELFRRTGLWRESTSAWAVEYGVFCALLVRELVAAARPRTPPPPPCPL